jgi:hypothetical protein
MSKKSNKSNDNIKYYIMIGICIIIIGVLLYLIYNKLYNQENFRFQKLVPRNNQMNYNNNNQINHNQINHNNNQINYNNNQHVQRNVQNFNIENFDININPELKNILKDDLSKFKNKLGNNINDPKFIETIKELKKVKDNLNYKEYDVNARILLPLQNEIDVEDVLRKSLTDPKAVDSYLKGETIPVDFGGSRIVTGGGNRIVLDGNNRWCQVYVINPHCKIKVLDFLEMGILGNTDKLQQKKARTMNIYKADENKLKNFIDKTMTNDVIQAFKNNGYNSKEDIIKHILGNIQFLKARNNPSQKSLPDIKEKFEYRGGTPETELKELLKDKYPIFVEKLGENILDPKFVATIKFLAEHTKINFMDINASVFNLIPTQNEIDMAKSLGYPLKDPVTARMYLSGGVISVAGKRIVTSADGKYIVDGHHRWSQVYVLNPYCSITAVDLSDIKGPFDALKATQLGIAADLGRVPTAVVQGVNMLTASHQQVKEFILSTITEPVFNVFTEFGFKNIEQIVNHIWDNIIKMREHNSPVFGAPKRDIMPQTDDAKNWKDYAPRISEGYDYQMNPEMIDDEEENFCSSCTRR